MDKVELSPMGLMDAFCQYLLFALPRQLSKEEGVVGGEGDVGPAIDEVAGGEDI